MASSPDYSILNNFQGQIVRPRTSFFYLVGLVLVAGTMLLLPLIYVALVGFVGYLVYYHAVHHFGIIMAWGGINTPLVSCRYLPASWWCFSCSNRSWRDGPSGLSRWR
jgi:hypothetical protein